MQVPLQITFHGLPHSDAIEARIREKAAKLEGFHGRITSCRVVVEERHRHSHQGKAFTVRVDLRVPGNDIVVDRSHHEDVYVALRDAFEAAARQLEDQVRVRRGEVKTHDVARRGRIARLFRDEGYGFIETPDGGEYYFSRDNVVESVFDRLEAGTAVQFIEDVANEGLQAKRVSLGKHGAAAD
jgi:ribosomal subunit interface protein